MSAPGVIGAYHRRPIRDYGLARPEVPALSEALYGRLGWSQFWDLETAQRLVNLGCQRAEPLLERLDAYRGWLVTDPQFREELQALRQRWGLLVQQLEHIPRYPVQIVPSPIDHPPENARDMTKRFVRALNTFFDRWELAGLATWDVPQPRGGNFSGLPLPPSVPSPPTQVTFQLSPILSLRANYPLHAMVEEAQRAQLPGHLQGWLKVVRQEHAGDLRFVRFRRMFLLHYYRDSVLASRYRDRFAGNIEASDRAFGRFLGGLSEDSVKKLRLQIEALRRGVR